MDGTETYTDQFKRDAGKLMAQPGAGVGDDPDGSGASFEFLLDGSFDAVGGPQLSTVRLRKREGRQPVGDVVFKPVGEFRLKPPFCLGSGSNPCLRRSGTRSPPPPTG